MTEALHRLGVLRLLGGFLDFGEVGGVVEPDRQILRRPRDRRAEVHVGKGGTGGGIGRLTGHVERDVGSGRQHGGDITGHPIQIAKGHNVIVDDHSPAAVSVGHEFHQFSFVV